jgi:hypothetical protein
MPRSSPRPFSPRRARAVAALAILLAALVAGLIAVLVSPGSARAEPGPESIFQDDDHLLYAPDATVLDTLGVLKSLGVDRIRVTVKWSLIAPQPATTVRPPNFNAADPGAYPAAAWAPYDRLLRMAAQDGIGVNFDLTAPGPLWAMKGNPPDQKSADHYAPSVAEWRQFVQAVGTRYSGSYAGQARVDYWSIWNEPNQPGWLAPQRRVVHGRRVLNSARLYREYADAAIRGLAATGHSVRSDTVLVGELAPEGSGNAIQNPVSPMPFLRAMYCVGEDYQRLRGSAASALGCPRDGSARAFVNANPALFQATGFAHHPYYFLLAPNQLSDNVDFAPLANLSRLEGGLDRIFRLYGVHRRIPIYLTEYGYQTNPPDPFQVVTPALQALYLNEADYLAWRDSRVRSVAQFLLYDALPDSRYPPSSFKYWDTFQTGLLYAPSGQPKPAFAAYRLPVWLPSTHTTGGGSLFVWGQLRPAPDATRQQALIQWRRRGGHYRTIATVTVPASSPEGYFTTRVRPPGTGLLHIAWRGPAGLIASRGVPITVG